MVPSVLSFAGVGRRESSVSLSPALLRSREEDRTLADAEGSDVRGGVGSCLLSSTCGRPPRPVDGRPPRPRPRPLPRPRPEDPLTLSATCVVGPSSFAFWLRVEMTERNLDGVDVGVDTALMDAFANTGVVGGIISSSSRGISAVAVDASHSVNGAGSGSGVIKPLPLDGPAPGSGSDAPEEPREVSSDTTSGSTSASSSIPAWEGTSFSFPFSLSFTTA